MTRNGKIARLPKALRDEVNQRLLDNEDTESLLAWLNQQLKAKAVMKTQFNGAMIDKHNLSEWRLGGYANWLCRQEALETIQTIAENAEEVTRVAGKDLRLSEHLDTVLTVQLARTAQVMMSQPAGTEEHWKRLTEALGQLNRIRRTNILVMQERREEERWDWEQVDRQRLDDEWIKKGTEKRRLKPFWAARILEPYAMQFGGGESGWKMAWHVVAAKYDLTWPPKKPGESWVPEGYAEKRAKRTPEDELGDCEAAFTLGEHRVPKHGSKGAEPDASAGVKAERPAMEAAGKQPEPDGARGASRPTTEGRGVSEPVAPKALGATEGPSESVGVGSCGAGERAVNIGEKEGAEKAEVAVEKDGPTAALKRGQGRQDACPTLGTETALPAKASVPEAQTIGAIERAQGRRDVCPTLEEETADAAAGVPKSDPLAFLNEPWRPGVPVFNKRPENPHVEPLMRAKLKFDDNPFRRRRRGLWW